MTAACLKVCSAVLLLQNDATILARRAARQAVARICYFCARHVPGPMALAYVDVEVDRLVTIGILLVHIVWAW